jgi:hypothetical protein
MVVPEVELARLVAWLLVGASLLSALVVGLAHSTVQPLVELAYSVLVAVLARLAARPMSLP